MNIHEGASRMKRAGRWMMLVPLTALVLLICVAGVWELFRHDIRSPLGLILPSIPLVIPGALLWLAGWIVEVFAQEGTERGLSHERPLPHR
jgi:hypothetical protein